MVQSNKYTLPLFDYPLWWVVSSYDLYLYTNDAGYVTKYYSVLINVLDKYYSGVTSAGSGLLNKPSGYGDYAFLPRSGIVTYYNALYVHALNGASFIASNLNKTDDATRWSKRAQLVSEAINTHMWDPVAGAYIDSLNSSSISHPQDGNSLAILSGAADSNRAASALSYLAAHNARPYGNAFYDVDPPSGGDFSKRVYAFMSYFELAARFKSQEAGSALEEIGRLYGWMASHDPGVTMWEGIGPDGSLYEGGFTSAAHGWSTGIVPLMVNSILGVQPIAPGLAKWKVRPQLAGLKWARGQVPVHGGGKILVSWSVGGAGPQSDVRIGAPAFSVDIEAPAGTSGTIEVPMKGISSTVSVNGVTAWDGKQGIMYSAAYRDGYLSINVDGGNLNVTVVD
jgi:hypothetical protein